MGKTPPDGSIARYKYTAAGMPETLADTQSTPRAIALDTTLNAVYWASFDPNGSITRILLGGAPGQPQVLATGLAYPNGIALDGQDVYWSNRGDGTIMRLSAYASPGTMPTTIAKGQASPGTVAVDGQYVYWVNEGSSSADTGAIMKLAKSP
jgi:hypothetical protein